MPTKPNNLSKLSKAQARIVIAKDAIKNVKAFKSAKQNTYLNQLGTFVDITQDNVCDILESGCEACAMGQLLLSRIKVFDAYKIDNRIHDFSLSGESVVDGLSKYFSAKQLALIESAFEQSYMSGGSAYRGSHYNSYTGEITGIEWDRAVEFGERYDDSNERFIAIAKNIIQNDGKFVPPPTKSEINKWKSRNRRRAKSL